MLQNLCENIYLYASSSSFFCSPLFFTYSVRLQDVYLLFGSFVQRNAAGKLVSFVLVQFWFIVSEIISVLHKVRVLFFVSYTLFVSVIHHFDLFISNKSERDKLRQREQATVLAFTMKTSVNILNVVLLHPFC